MKELETPCYVINSNGMRDFLSYEDDWCYGKSRVIEFSGDVREAIKADIRKKPNERNGIPIYTVSDHGNVNRIRAIRLRKV